MVYIEPSFPRGRKTEAEEDTKPRKKLRKNNEYGASTSNDEKPQKPRQKERRQTRLEKIEQEKEDLEQSVSAASLQFKTAREGMLVLGCVFKIKTMELMISIPGGLFGIVPITSISEAYTNRLQSLMQGNVSATAEQCPGLDQLYAVGELVYVKITGKFDNKRFTLTLDPKELHSEFSHKHLVEGLILSATVEEEEDHGYQMNVGIKNVRAFLPTQNVRKNKIEVGANVCCKVEKVSQTTGSATIILKAFKPTEPRKLEIAEANLDSLVPGSVVTFTVESVLSNGLQGTLFDDTVPAFVSENMLEKPLSKLKNYELFKQIQARILYVMPLTKYVFLTLANYEANRMPVKSPVLPGTVVQDAKVVHKCHGGVWFQIDKNHKALMPKFFIKSNYKQNYDEQVVMAKYHVNSLHTVRVLRYEVFDRTIIVSDDEKMLEAKYFSVRDVKVGQTYECSITKVLPKKRGYLVALGNIKGIVTSHNFKYTKPLAVNQSIKLCLVAIEEDRPLVQFTNHPQYFKKSAKLITCRENIVAGQKYLGTIISEQEKFFVVVFCNKITGILFKFCRAVTQDQDALGRMKLGAVGHFTVHEVSNNGEKLTLSIPLAAGSENLGHLVTGTVTGVFATGADIYLVTENETGVIPPEAYSDFPEHSVVYQNVLKEGEQLQVVNMKENVYSCRDAEYFRYKPTKVADVKLGQILRAYCEHTIPSKKKICFKLALKDYSKKVVLRESEFHSDPDGFRIHEGEVVLVKVVRKIRNNGEEVLRVSPKLAEVCTHGAEDSLRYMHTYLNDVKELMRRFKSLEKPFAQYTVGQNVTCVVESFIDDNDQMIVRLGDDEKSAKGIATKDPKKDDYVLGDQLQGRVVWLDVEKQLVHVCVVKNHLKHLIDGELADVEKELFNVDERRKFITLFKNNYVAVGCLKKIECPLVVIPVKCHYNDFEPLEVGRNVNVVCIRKFEGLVYGMAEESYDKFKNLKRFVQTKKQKENKDCWLPDDFEEPILEDEEKSPILNNEDRADVGSQSDSGIDKDEEFGNSAPTAKSAKKSKKSQKNKSNKQVSKVDKRSVVASPGKILKIKKQKKQAIAKKLSDKKSFVISQLDGADDFIRRKKSKSLKSKKSFLSSGPIAKAPDISKHPQSGLKQNTKHNKKDKLHQLAQKPLFKKKSKRKFESEAAGINRGATKGDKLHAKQEALPGAETFWSTKPIVQKHSESDSSDDDDESEKQAKSRLTAKERFEAMKQEEQRIRKIEEELADASVDPHTPDQFDRLVLAQPNSSLLWIRYMVFHMESAEIEKARAVARRAIKTINFREENERLNVWMALLNLELRYETIETFKEVLQEAIRYNDAFKVYSRAIEILIDCGKVPEVLEMIETLQKRFRKQSEMWLLIADSFYKIDHRSKVKPLLSKALKSLENKEHIPLIVKFAFLHNRNGERDEAHILFEQILTSYPKRTDIWSQYVDILVKDGLIDVARQTLDRAIAQRLPMRNMKTLYTKYVNFEEKQGNREAVKKIKQMAADYVKQQLSGKGVVDDD